MSRSNLDSWLMRSGLGEINGPGWRACTMGLAKGKGISCLSSESGGFVGIDMYAGWLVVALKTSFLFLT
ncbi:unnamed protein product [Coffea canephora]|uniref:Uncharacterized protein n=1 Tax=Coffea canephora TaxID=49390 RepID=A0A068TS03_COFCA|nr:unnamed protein product [Coffea canephora]